MDSIPFDPTWLTGIRTLGDAERGRLLLAYLEYALGGDPAELRGNERYLWPVVKDGLDKHRTRSDRQKKNAEAGWQKRRINDASMIHQRYINDTSMILSPSSSPASALSSPPLESPSSSPSDSPITTPYNPPCITPDSTPSTAPSLSRSNTLAERFDHLWELYPKKQGKKQAFESYKRAIRDGSTDEEIEAGIKAYTEYAKNKDSQYIKQGSSFFRQKAWEDDWKPEENIWIERIKRGDFDDEDGNGTDSGNQGGDVPWWELFDRESDQRVDDAPWQLPG